jgi:NAD(P)-dependent dehydrogenase (short-subunit alcohol dehydrogenase family)
MPRRVEGKAAIVVGGGQTRGETIGNGRATALVLAREGARVLVADRHLASAQDTVDLIRGAAGEAWAFEADITNEDAVHNNVGASLALGDAAATDLTEQAFQRSFDVNLKAMWLACKHALLALRESAGSIVNISSMAARNAPRTSPRRTRGTASAPTASCPA